MRRSSWRLVVFVLALAASGRAADVPVAGAVLDLRASATKPARRSARLVLRDAAIAAPLPDPRADGATLVLHGGAAAGQCWVHVALPAAGWRAVGRPSPKVGYRFRDPRRPRDVVGVQLRPGRVQVTARGAAFPCDLSAAQRVPVTATLRVGTTRWCGAFGGRVGRNGPGRLVAKAAPAPAACPDADVTAASLNVLHGIACPGDDLCRFADRVDLWLAHLVAAGCPDVVALQEILFDSVPVIDARLPGPCGYQRVYEKTNAVDDAMLLTRVPVVTSSVTKLRGGFRNLLFVRLDHPLGPLDVFVTHLASDSDGATAPCGDGCPAECVAAGATVRRDCQSVQVAALVGRLHTVATPALVAGDFNESPGSFVYRQMTDPGWIDTYLAAGHPECVPATGVGCTSGRVDDDLSQMESRATNESERIDFVFAVPPTAGSCTVDGAGDADGDGARTGLFADAPNPFAPACGPAPAPICWPSDHVGTQVDIDCR